jgi:hypothetical protein
VIVATLGDLATLDIVTQVQGGQPRLRAANVSCSVPVRVIVGPLDTSLPPGNHSPNIGGNSSINDPIRVYLGQA